MQFGSTINPALGRTDYSAYTQGAAQGAQAIGQGIQQLGAGIGAGIKEWAEQKKQLKKEDAEIKSADAFVSLASKHTKDPEIAASLEDMQRRMSTGTHEERIAIARQIPNYFDSAIKMKSMADAKSQQDADALAMASATGINQAFNWGPNDAPNFGGDAIDTTPIQMTPAQARSAIAARNAQLSVQQTQAGINKLNAEINALNAGKPEKESPQSFNTIEEARPFAEKSIAGNKALDYRILPNPKGRGYTYEVFSKPLPNVVDPEADALGKLSAARKVAEFEFSQRIPEMVSDANDAISVIDTPTTNVGELKQFKDFASSLMAVGGSKKAAKDLSDTQRLESILGKQSFDFMKNSGISSRSFDSNKEREMLDKANGSDPKLQREALKWFQEYKIKLLKEAASKWNTNISSPAYESLRNSLNASQVDMSIFNPIQGKMNKPPVVKSSSSYGK